MKDETFIAVLLDRSGSMGSVKDETISGFNHFLKEQREGGDNAILTLVQFDSRGIDTVHESEPIKDVPELNDDTYQPRGGTPLLDALGKTITSAGKILSAIPEENRPDKIVFVVITDGLENASHEYSKSQIKEMIEHQTTAYKWQFVYLGANQDAIAEGANIGIAAGMAASYNTASMDSAFSAAASNVRNYRIRPTAASLNFSSRQRARMSRTTKEKETA